MRVIFTVEVAVRRDERGKLEPELRGDIEDEIAALLEEDDTRTPADPGCARGERLPCYVTRASVSDQCGACRLYMQETTE